MSMVEKLTYLKKRDRMTTEKLSLLSGVPLSTLNKILTGQTRNPAMRPIYAISRTFRVPVCYLMDDSIPIHCDLMAYAQVPGVHFFTNQEMELILKFRQLFSQEQRMIQHLLQTLWRCHTTSQNNPKERLLPCYIPTVFGTHGASTTSLQMKYLWAANDSLIHNADFTIKLPLDTLSPTFHAGDILAVQTGIASHDQLGLFQIGSEIILRRFYHKRGVTKLVSINVGVQPIQVRESSRLICHGIILGIVHTYRWL